MVSTTSEPKIIDSTPDGNCAFRSVIESLLVQGLLKDKKEWILKFIEGLVARTADNLKLEGMASLQHEGKVKLDNPTTFTDFITQYKNLTLDQLDSFSAYFFRRTATPHTNTSDHHIDEKIEAALLKEDNAKISSLLESGCPIDKEAVDDSILYYLSACLRRDIFLSVDENPEVITDKLHEHACMLGCDAYFQKHKIGVSFYDSHGEPNEYAAAQFKNCDLSKRDIDIHLVHRNEHYAILLPNKDIENFEKKLSLEAKELQIKEDEAIAKELQMEEIKNFAKQFKTGNKNNLSFISNVIKGLGLEKELGNEQWSHLHALQSSTTIEQIVQSLQSVINNLGYSPHFKEKLKTEIKSYSSTFFSTCRQEARESITENFNPPLSL